MPLSALVSRIALVIASALALAACGADGGAPPGDAGDAAPDSAADVGDAAADATDVGDTGAPPDTATDAVTDAPDADSDSAARPDTDLVDIGPDDTGRDTFYDPDVRADADTTPTPTGPLGVLAVDPASGPSEGGTFIVVFGYGFTVDTDLLINGRLADGIDFVDSETLLARTPANPAGAYDVKVADSAGEAVLVQGFSYFADLAIESVQPSSGPERGGVPMTATGAGFTRDTILSVGGRLGIDTRVVSTSEIEFVLPPGSVGRADVRVTNEFGSEVAVGAVEYYAEPAIRQIVPAAGPTAGGYAVEVRGAGFEAGTRVTFGPSNAPSEVHDAGRMTVQVPAGAAGPSDVTVMTSRGGDTAVGGFYYVADPDGALHVRFVAPARGDASGGYFATLGGPGLHEADSVRFGGVDAPIVSRSPGAVVVEVPAGAGVVAVSVAAGDVESTLESAFEYVPSIRIDAVTPSFGDVAGGERVTIEGTGFAAGAGVRFGAIPAASVTRLSDTALSVVTPPNTIGPVDVTVSDRYRAATAYGAYTYVEEPTVSSLAPTRGAIAGNTYVLVRGRGFQGDVQVYFGDTEAAEVEVIDPATLAVRTPAAAEAGRIAVTVLVDGTEVGPTRTFVYYDPFTPALGWWGDAIRGAVNVTVIDILSGERIPDAFVTLHIRIDDTARTCITDAVGQCTISHPDVEGEQTISASAEGYSAVTVNHVDAENVVIALTSTDPPTPGPPPGSVPPRIWGTLEGLDKIIDPADDELIMGIVRTTTPGVGVANPPGTGFAQVVWTSGSTPIPYEMNSREGELAVVALCGVFNERTGDFTPLYMGIARGLAVRGEGTDYEVHLECDIHMSQSMAFKFRNAPLYPGGPDVNEAIPYLNFGGEGATNLLRWAEGTSDVIVQDHFAPLDAPALAGVTYDVIGQSVSSSVGLPFSVVYARGISDPDDRVDFPVSVPPAELVNPRPGGTLVERRFEWTLSTVERPDFYYAYITDTMQMVTYWEVWLPGDETGFNLPYFPPGSAALDLPPGPLVFIVLAIDAISFDYDAFEFNDFGSNNWLAYSANGWVVYNP